MNIDWYLTCVISSKSNITFIYQSCRLIEDYAFTKRKRYTREYFSSYWSIIGIFFSVITNPKVAIGAKDSTKAFNFDFSYWSHDVSAQPLSIFSIFIKNSYVIACTIKYTGIYFLNNTEKLGRKFYLRSFFPILIFPFVKKAL